MMAAVSGNNKELLNSLIKSRLDELAAKQKTNEGQKELLDKDKLILVIYVGVRTLSRDASDKLVLFRESILSLFDDSVKVIVVPVKDSDSIKVEALNTQTIPDNSNKNKLVDTINKLEQAIEKLYDTQIA